MITTTPLSPCVQFFQYLFISFSLALGNNLASCHSVPLSTCACVKSGRVMCSEQAQIHMALLSTSPFTITLQLHHPQHRFDRQFLLLENLEASVKNEALFIKLWWQAWSKRKVKQIEHPFCWTPYTPNITSAHKNLRHGGFISTNEIRVAFLFLKSPWNVFHLLKNAAWF